MCWMVQNWHQAHTLDISFTQLKVPPICIYLPTGRKLRSTAASGVSEVFAIMKRQMPLSGRLIELSLDLHGLGYMDSLESWTSAVQAKSPRLQTFQLVTPKPFLLPALDNLTCLVIRSRSLPEFFEASITRLPKLQTLLLSIKDDRSYTRAGLDLRACKDLKHIVLQIVIPKALKCPEGCSVCVDCDPLLSMEAWKDLRMTCTSCHLSGRYSAMASPFLQKILLMECPSLVYLSLTSQSPGPQVGDAERPLVISDTLPKLKHLRVDSQGDIFVRFQQSVRLESVRLAGKELHMGFEDVGEFVLSLKQASFSWMESDSNDMEALLAAMESYGKPCEIQETAFKGPLQSSSYGEQLSACTCSACANCLSKAGRLPRLLWECKPACMDGDAW